MRMITISRETTANGLSPKLVELFTAMFQSGQSEAFGVADCLNCIASNGDGQEGDDHMLACAEEMLTSVQQVINLLKPPPKPATDPYVSLIVEATKAANKIDANNAITRHAAEDNTVALRIAITELEDQLRNNVSNRGGVLELHRFHNRKLTTIERLYLAGAKKYAKDGELEFDGDTVISKVSDPGAYVLGWSWVYDDALEQPHHFSGSLFYNTEAGERHLLGRDSCIAVEQADAQRFLMDKFWDDRLDSASCTPDIEWHEVELQTFTFDVGTDDDADTREIKAVSHAEALEILQIMLPNVVVKEGEDTDGK